MPSADEFPIACSPYKARYSRSPALSDASGPRPAKLFSPVGETGRKHSANTTSLKMIRGSVMMEIAIIGLLFVSTVIFGAHAYDAIHTR